MPRSESKLAQRRGKARHPFRVFLPSDGEPGVALVQSPKRYSVRSIPNASGKKVRDDSIRQQGRLGGRFRDHGRIGS